MNDVYRGRLFDGRIAVGKNAQVVIRPRGLDVFVEGDEPRCWFTADLRIAGGASGVEPLVLACGEARLSMDDPGFRQALRTSAPELFPGFGPREIRRTAVFATIGAAALAGLAVLFTYAPSLIAAHTPIGIERELADNLTESLPVCMTAAHSRALTTIVDLLSAQASLPGPLSVEVVRGDLVNAFALPGARILVFQGLIQAAETPDQLAAVLAHEIAHVEARDPMRHLVEDAGLLVVASVVFGNRNALGAIGKHLVLTAHSREAERAADVRAVELLKATGQRSDGLASFLQSVAADNALTRVAAYLMTHPKTEDRVERLREMQSAQGRTVVEPEDWKRLKNACKR